MDTALCIVIVVLLLFSAPHASLAKKRRPYDPLRPELDHERAARRFQRNGQDDMALKALRSQALFGGDAKDYLHLGKFLAEHRFHVGNDGKDLLLEASQALEMSLWLDRNNGEARELLMKIDKDREEETWSGGVKRKAYLKKQFSRKAKPRDDTELAREVSVSNDGEFFAFLKSREFLENYFEKEPVLIRGPPSLLSWTYSMETMLGQWLKVGNGGYDPPYRNVNFLKGSLAPSNDDEGLPRNYAMRSGLKSALARGYSPLHAEG